MKTLIILHDTPLNTPRGAELTLLQLAELGNRRGYNVQFDVLKDFESTKGDLVHADIVIVSSTSRCDYELDLIEFILASNKPYVKIEYDYNFCIRRNILCTVDRKVTNCCNTGKFHLFRKLFAGSCLNVFQSPNHYKAHYDFFGKAVSNHLIMPPTVLVDNLKISEEKRGDTIPFFGDLNYLKGGKAYVAYAEEHPHMQFPVYGKNWLRQEIPENITFHDPISNNEVLEILGRTKTLICQPVWPEPSGRLVAEAFLSGCNIIGNDRIGTFSFDFYPDHKDQAIKEMKETLENFWNAIDEITEKQEHLKSQKLGTVLVYKSYGGLGDIFFAIPSIYKLAKVSDELHFAVAPRLLKFFSQHLHGVKVIGEDYATEHEHLYDKIIELGNYPAFRGYDLPHALKYPTHKKVKQHAIQHYIDTISKLHIEIDNGYEGYPYFDRNVSTTKPYFVVHHGAGFLLKIWPTKKYAELIETLQQLYPHLDCKIIKGPDDPNIETLFSKSMPHVEYIEGGMVEVGQAMSGALFHIGNDAGITHVAGAYNVPSVGIYGPTGPGSWGSFAEQNELIWGKKGVCNIRCNYDVILNCEHRICLNSITVSRVMEALYKVLQKAYPIDDHILKINPELEIEYGKNDCLIKLHDNEFLLEYHNDTMRTQICHLLEGNKPGYMDANFQLTFDVLKQQHILFEVPTFQPAEVSMGKT